MNSVLSDLIPTIPEEIIDFLPENIQSFLDKDLSALTGDVADVVSQYLPQQIDFQSSLPFLGIFAAAFLLLGVLGRAVLGQRSDLNRAASCAIGILFIYMATVVIYSFGVTQLERFLSPLPFATISGDYLILFSFTGAEISEICYHVLSMVILAFVINLIDTFVPRGKGIISWYLLRFITVILAMVLHLIANWALTTYLPDVLVTYAPILLLGVLVVMMLLGVVKFLLGLVLTITSPILGGIYAFFFSNKIGKELSKAVLTTLLLCVLVYVLNQIGCTVVLISSAVLTAYIPLVVIALVLWYLVGHLL